jgi:hypothetical protein
MNEAVGVLQELIERTRIPRDTGGPHRRREIEAGHFAGLAADDAR